MTASPLCHADASGLAHKPLRFSKQNCTLSPQFPLSIRPPRFGHSFSEALALSDFLRTLLVRFLPRSLPRLNLLPLFFVLLRSLSERAVGVVAAAVSRSSAWVLARVTSLLALRRDQDAAPEWALVQAR